MRFETKEDRANERMIMEVFARGHEFIKLDDHDVDFVIPGKCYVEVKAKKYKHNKYPGQMISLIKILKLQEKGREINPETKEKIPAFLVFGYTDYVAYIEINDVEGYVRLGGRKKRKGAANDRELILYIPTEKMSYLPASYSLLDSDNQIIR